MSLNANLSIIQNHDITLITLNLYSSLSLLRSRLYKHDMKKFNLFRKEINLQKDRWQKFAFPISFDYVSTIVQVCIRHILC